MPPTTHVQHYVNGKIKQEGVGLSFWYFAPTTTLVAVPVGSREVPFIFEEVTSDYQSITAQGQITFRIIDPITLAKLLDYSLDQKGREYKSSDPDKLPERLINLVHALMKMEIQSRPLSSALREGEIIGTAVLGKLRASLEVQALGLEILGFSILALKPTPETAHALEAETRESLMLKADEAIYLRRNASVEQERSIRENELQTEIAIELKKRQIRETQMASERALQEQQHELEKSRLASRVALEADNRELTALRAENAKVEADAKAYASQALMNILGKLDQSVLQALSHASMSPEQLISQAFGHIAEKAEKIGQLNISPDLLREILHSRPNS